MRSGVAGARGRTRRCRLSSGAHRPVVLPARFLAPLVVARGNQAAVRSSAHIVIGRLVARIRLQAKRATPDVDRKAPGARSRLWKRTENDAIRRNGLARGQAPSARSAELVPRDSRFDAS